MGLGQVVEDVPRRRLWLLAEQRGHWASCHVTVEEIPLERPGSQTDRRDVIPEQKRTNDLEIVHSRTALSSYMI